MAAQTQSRASSFIDRETQATRRAVGEKAKAAREHPVKAGLIAFLVAAVLVAVVMGIKAITD